jgi:hypothetical protein
MEYLEFIMRDAWRKMYEGGIDIETADKAVIQEIRFLFAPSTLERPRTQHESQDFLQEERDQRTRNPFGSESQWRASVYIRGLFLGKLFVDRPYRRVGDIVLVDQTISTCEDESNEKQDVWSKWLYSPYMVDDFRGGIGQTRIGEKACKGKIFDFRGDVGDVFLILIKIKKAQSDVEIKAKGCFHRTRLERKARDPRTVCEADHVMNASN